VSDLGPSPEVDEFLKAIRSDLAAVDMAELRRHLGSQLDRVLDTPAYEHDCDECCSFLGRYTEDGQVYDLYWHDYRRDLGVRHTTVVARYSNDGPDYSSGSFDTGALNEARRRAALLFPDYTPTENC
jgi:hypothetical protein